MSDATCKTCPFWQERTGRPEGDDRDGYGLCHHVHAHAEFEAWRYGDWWCSEHPLRQRDRLAAMAMQGIMANTEVLSRLEEDDRVFADEVAGLAHQIADAMLAARASPSVEGAARGDDK